MSREQPARREQFKVWRELKPKYVIATFDYSSKTFRKAKFADYKATRGPAPDASGWRNCWLRSGKRRPRLSRTDDDGVPRGDRADRSRRQDPGEGRKVGVDREGPPGRAPRRGASSRSFASCSSVSTSRMASMDSRCASTSSSRFRRVASRISSSRVTCCAVSPRASR